MSTEQNKAVVRRFVEEVLSQGNLALIDELFASDYTNYGFGQPFGREGFLAVLGQFRSAFPDLRFTIEDMVAEGDRVMIRGTARGTHRGEFNGIPPTGKQITVSLMTDYRLANGKIVEDRPLTDMLSLLQQVGAVPAPAHP